MTKFQHTLDPKHPDPFETYHTVYRDKARLQWYVAGLLLSHLVLVLALVGVAIRPPRVIVKDRIDGQLPQLSIAQRAPAITAIDARVFFVNIVKQRYGWDSLTVDRDLRAYLGQCVSHQREMERAHLQEIVTDEKETGREPRSRLQGWIGAGIQNTLVLPENPEDIACVAQDGLWHCYMQMSIVTQKLGFPDEVRAPPARVAIFATLLEVPHTIGTLSGLVVGAMRQAPVPISKEGA